MSRLCGIAALLLLLALGDARAELRALLVGVSGYPKLPEALRLHGPRNDVQRLRDVLVRRGADPARIRLLADGVSGAGEPTRAAILRALDELADAANRGDTVVVYFAGHGSRQPTGRDERSGLEAILLPIDAGRWDGRAGRVANAIAATDWRERIDRIGARGASVWAVFDACHSGGLVRGDPAGLRWRQVDPSLLGIPAEVLPAAPVGRHRVDGRDATTGNAAYFYASQADEPTAELELPIGDPQRRVHGVFSHLLAQALERAGPMSYRQLGQAVLAAYGPLAPARGTPIFSGDALDTPVLGQGEVPARRWPLRVDGGLSVPVGRLAGVGPGTVFAVLPDPLAPAQRRIGHLVATTVEATHAALAPAAHAGLAAPAPDALRPGQSLEVIASPPAFGLRVAADLAGCPTGCPLREAVAMLRAQGAASVELDWTDAGALPDVLLRVRDGRALLLTPALQRADAATQADGAGLPLREHDAPVAAVDLAARLGRALHGIARARNLVALGERYATEARTAGLFATLARAGSGAPITPDQAARLRNGDRLALIVENRAAAPLDLTVLYLDADHRIEPFFPTRLGETNRLSAGERRVIDGIRIHAPPEGLERLLLIGVPAGARTERADFSFLAQPALPRRRGEAGDALDEDFAAFADAAFADHRTRGEPRPATPGKGSGMVMFTLDVRR